MKSSYRRPEKQIRMGRPRKPPDEIKDKHLNIKMRGEYHEFLMILVTKAKAKDFAEFFERMVAREAKRLRLPPPPPR